MRGYGESEDEYLKRLEAEERAANGWHCAADFPYLISSAYSDFRRPDESPEDYAMRKTAELRTAEGWHSEAYLPFLFSQRTERDDTKKPGVLYMDLEFDDEDNE